MTIFDLSQLDPKQLENTVWYISKRAESPYNFETMYFQLLPGSTITSTYQEKYLRLNQVRGVATYRADQPKRLAVFEPIMDLRASLTVEPTSIIKFRFMYTLGLK